MNKKIIGPITLIVSLIGMCVIMLFFLVKFPGAEEEIIDPSSTEIDMSLEYEEKQWEILLDQFMYGKDAFLTDERLYSVSESGSITFDNPEMVANDFVPSGSKCLGAYILEESVLLSYQLDNVNYIVQYSKERIDKAARELESDYAYSINSINKEIELINVNDSSKIRILSEIELQEMKQQNKER